MLHRSSYEMNYLHCIHSELPRGTVGLNAELPIASGFILGA